jgi:transposase-like protein
MAIIVPGITSLAQHLQRLATDPEAYRPEDCPHCGKARLWWHGHYTRQADRYGHGEANLNPVAIPRFLCSHCRRSCSSLPACLPPRRWYLWAVQQQALAVLVAGGSRHQAGRTSGCYRSTVRRWWRWLQAQSGYYRSVLQARFAELGRSTSADGFWQRCWQQIGGLSGAMYWLHQDGVVIP